MTRSLRELVAAARERRERQRRKLYLRWASGERCATCAYRQGTEASGDDVDRGLTRFRRALLDAAQPFMCHEPGPMPGRQRLCIGHMDAMGTRTRAGYYDQHPPDAPEVVAELREASRIREQLYAEEPGQ
jgi:hypothetical protein